VTHKIKILSQVRLEGDIERSYHEAVRKIDDLADRLSQPLPSSSSPQKPANSTPGYTSNFSKESFINSVRKIKQYINAGEVIQVQLSQRLARPTTAAPFEIYRALRSINPLLICTI
jgi:anthranilate synthase component 1